MTLNDSLRLSSRIALSSKASSAVASAKPRKPSFGGSPNRRPFRRRFPKSDAHPPPCLVDPRRLVLSGSAGVHHRQRRAAEREPPGDPGRHDDRAAAVQLAAGDGQPDGPVHPPQTPHADFGG